MTLNQCVRMNICYECGEPLTSDNRSFDNPAYCFSCSNYLFDEDEADDNVEVSEDGLA